MVDVEAMLAVLKDIDANTLIEQEVYEFNWEDSRNFTFYFRESALNAANIIEGDAERVQVSESALLDVRLHDLVFEQEINEYEDEDQEVTLTKYTITTRGRKFMTNPYGMKPSEPRYYLDRARVWSYPDAD